MAAKPPPAKPKGKPGLLKAKLGPVPVWIIAAALLAVVGFVVLRKRAGGGSGDVSDAVLSGGQIGPQAAASGGQPSTNGAPGQMLDPSVLDALQSISDSVGGLSSDLTYFVQTQPAASEAPSAVQAAASGQATAAQAPAPAAVNTAAQKQTNTPQPAAGVLWDGRLFTTKAALSSWLSARGATYATWAKNHPSAATKLR